MPGVHAMTRAWFGRKLWALSGGRQLQDSEKHPRCGMLGQGGCGGASTAAYKEGAAGWTQGALL